MTENGRRGGNATERCPECGVELKAGIKFCDFCGTKVAVEAVVPAPANKRSARTVGGVLKGIAVACAVIGALAYFGNHFKKQDPPPVPLPSSLDGKYRASAACEAAIREKAPVPFRVIAFRSTLVAEERSGYVVSGSVEMQSLAGEVQRKRYFCRVSPDSRGGMVPELAKIGD